MKLLHLEIRECRECPWQRGLGPRICYHPATEDTFDSVKCPASGIPDWCPLPNAEDKERI